MMQPVAKGRLIARVDAGPSDVRAVQALRGRCFRAGTGPDQDAIDLICRHVLIENRDTGVLVGCFRLMLLSSGVCIGDSYAARFYDLSALAQYDEPMIEMGRFCIAPDVPDHADILRLAWGAMTRHVDQAGVGMIFGCASFPGTDVAPYQDSFAMLRDRHLAPRRWRPRVKAPKVFRFVQRGRSTPDAKRALTAMPSLLRSYLAMGGWVSDHAVVDDDLNTLHVFTAVEVKAVPPARARLLRAVVG